MRQLRTDMPLSCVLMKYRIITCQIKEKGSETIIIN